MNARMRTFAVVLALAGSTVTAHADMLRADWVVVVVEAGSTPASGAVRLWGPVETGDGPSVIGVAHDDDITGYAVPNGHRPLISTTDDAGGLLIEIVQSSASVEVWNIHVHYNLDEGERTSFLVFRPGARMNGLRSALFRSDGDPAVTIAMGGGSQVRPLMGPGATGPGASLASVTAGASTRTESLPAGAIGFMPFWCDRCEGGWSNPHATGSWSAHGGVSEGFGYSKSGTPGFAGPAGPWSWRWEGAMLAQGSYVPGLGGPPQIAAWAPVGTLWTLFTTASPDS